MNLYITNLLVSSFYGYYELMRLCIAGSFTIAIVIVIIVIICIILVFTYRLYTLLAFIIFTYSRFAFIIFTCTRLAFWAAFTITFALVFAIQITFYKRAMRTLGAITPRHYTVCNDNNKITPRYAV
jgi:hypothetical protein